MRCPSAGLDDLVVKQEEEPLKQHFDIKAPKVETPAAALVDIGYWWTDAD